jgi:hypothetical protein
MALELTEESEEVAKRLMAVAKIIGAAMPPPYALGTAEQDQWDALRGEEEDAFRDELLKFAIQGPAEAAESVRILRLTKARMLQTYGKSNEHLPPIQTNHLSNMRNLGERLGSALMAAGYTDAVKPDTVAQWRTEADPRLQSMGWEAVFADNLATVMREREGRQSAEREI